MFFLCVSHHIKHPIFIKQVLNKIVDFNQTIVFYFIESGLMVYELFKNEMFVTFTLLTTLYIRSYICVFCRSFFQIEYYTLIISKYYKILLN